MGFYSKFILPHIIDSTCKQSIATKQREKIIHLAEGDVLEIGIGSGLNLPFYDSSQVRHLIGIDPSEELWKKQDNNVNPDFEVEYIKTGAESMPLESNSIDSVVITYTMCSIPDLVSSFDEIRRVMKSNANLIFCEHGKAPDHSIEKWQNRLNPIWKLFGGGCNLNRDIPKLILDNGFRITDLNTMYLPGWKPATFNYWGMAKTL